VSTQWLADYLGADQLVVLDASVLVETDAAEPLGHNASASGTEGDGGGTGAATDDSPRYVSGHESYLVNGHIPSAIFADVITDLSDPDGEFPFTRPNAERFAAAVGALGIDNETTVVVYDSAVGEWASRVWWLFRTFGYDRVAVLDGGFASWTLEERSVELGRLHHRTATFVTVERPELWVDKAYIEGVVRGDIAAELVCASASSDFAGGGGEGEGRGDTVLGRASARPPVNVSAAGRGTSAGAGSAGTGSTGAGSTGAGSAGAGSAGTGSPGAGSTGAGSAGAGSAGTGSTGAGSTGAGSAGAGAREAGSTGAGSAGTGSAGAGSAGAGSTGAGSAGAGARAAGSTATGTRRQESRRSRRGHIPGSVSVPATSLVDRNTHAIGTEDELRRQFASALGKGRIVVYCSGGIAATADALALTLLGETAVAVYDGSLNEWSADPSAELVTTE
jgi:thiosulfate/3-mercaptopyruvate sulfurtransferase